MTNHQQFVRIFRMNFFKYNYRAVVAGPLAIVLLWSLTITASGKVPEATLPPPHGHVNDFAGVIDTDTQQRLNNILDSLKQRTGINFVIATVKTAGDQDLYEYSLRVINDWNLGSRTSTE